MPARLTTLLRVRTRAAWNSICSLRRQSNLKIAVIIFFATGLWIGLFLLFLDAFRFLDNEMVADFRPFVVDILFAVFFLSLFVMLMFSNGVIAYGSLFRSRETAFFFSSPVRTAHIFVCNLSEALLFSSWAFLFLALPLVVAFGVCDKAPWYYYPGAAAFFAVFAILPAAAGALVTLLVARFLSRSPIRVLILVAALLLGLGTVWGLGVAKSFRLGMAQPGEAWIQSAMGQLSLSQSPLLPSYWSARGIQQLARGKFTDAAYRFGLLISTALFASMISIHAARWFYRDAYHRAQALRRRRKGRATFWFYRLLERALFWMNPKELRILIIKDVKTFLRDPVQWSQILIFFGLLAVYFINMRNLQYDIDSPFWKNLIGLLNLIATSLTLSTFTTRFIFPLLSLEGQKFWILGLLPINRRNLLYSKFWFTFVGSFLISEGLIVISDLILGVSLRVIAMHAVTVLLICSGLSGLAVGTGAIYPNLREDNPSKIVSGFGGTLNLVLSVLFVAAIVTLIAVPYHVSAMGRDLRLFHLSRFTITCSILAVLLGAVATIAPIWLGVRAFQRLET